MSCTDTLVGFLLARYAEQIANAERAEEYPWLVAHRMECDWWGDVCGYCTCKAADRALVDAVEERRIVEWHSEWAHVCPSGLNRWKCGEDWIGCPELLALAASFADHKDYREEWKP